MLNNQDNEADFCDSYKSQILGHGKQTEEVSFLNIFLKLLTIVLLLVAIVGFIFYGYKYFMDNKTINHTTSLPSSIQVSDEELVVKMQETEVDEKKELKEIVEKISPPVSQQVKELEMEKMANDVKILIANSETKEENEAKETLSQDRQEIEKLEVPSSSAPEAQYLEELADLSKEIDKERSQ